jgi:hypothetical protein
MNSAHANNVHKNNEKTSPINLHRNRPPLALLAAILATLGSGCGGSSSTSSHTLSAAQAQAVSGQVVQAVTAALGDALGATPAAANGSRHSLSTVMANAHPDASSSGCTSTATGQSCNLPLSYTGPCSGGGSISVSGDISGTLDNSGDGSFGTQMTITPSLFGVRHNFQRRSRHHDRRPNCLHRRKFCVPHNLHGRRGISYGPNPSGTCQVSVSYSINASSCTVTGTLCGQSVNGSC